MPACDLGRLRAQPRCVFVRRWRPFPFLELVQLPRKVPVYHLQLWEAGRKVRAIFEYLKPSIESVTSESLRALVLWWPSPCEPSDGQPGIP